jgi:hypothetical protein
MGIRNSSCIHLSASAIGSLKACPTRYRLAYAEGLRPAEDTEAQRMGTNWHALHEVFQNAHTESLAKSGGSPPCNDEAARAQALDAVARHLNQTYETVPDWVPADVWARERMVLWISFVAYLNYWRDDPIEPLASEVAFKLPLTVPGVGLPLPVEKAVRVGKIDTVVRWRGMVGNREMKSTSRSVEPDSDFWDRASKDTQVSMYALAFRDMAAAGLDQYGIEGVSTDDRVGNTLYDVWHKPTIKPKALSQKDTAAFIESGEYCGAEFEVAVAPDDHPEDPTTGVHITVDGERATVEMGKSGKPAVTETVDMFGARLMADIMERPHFYFARREIARTDRDLVRFRKELWNLYLTMGNFQSSGCWYENEAQCRATFSCQYIPICYGPGADAVCDGETTPEGFKRIHVDLTVGGQLLEE